MHLYIEGPNLRGRQIAHTAVSDHHSFGLARRTRGVNYIGQVIGRETNSLCLQICNVVIRDCAPFSVQMQSPRPRVSGNRGLSCCQE